MNKGVPKAKKSLWQRYAAAPHIVWSALFIIAPLFFVGYFAFTGTDGAFTIANIKEFFTPAYLKIFARSVRLAFIATFICLLIGYPAAYFVSKAKPKTQRILIMLIMLPMWMNFLIRTYALQMLLLDSGIINSALNFLGFPSVKMIDTSGAVILGMVYDFLPYMVLPIYSVLAKLDIKLIEAANDLGCNSFGVMRRVILPLSKPGIFSGIIMVFVPSISTFYISQKLGGDDFILIGDVIERKYLESNYNMVASISFVLMIILLISLAIANKASNNEVEVQP